MNEPTQLSDRAPHPAADGDAGGQDEPNPKAPRWVMIVAIILTIAVLGGIVVLHLTGVIGPGLHGGGLVALPSR